MDLYTYANKILPTGLHARQTKYRRRYRKWYEYCETLAVDQQDLRGSGALRERFQDPKAPVDDLALQGRFSRRGLRKVLHDGHLMIMTVSKFYGGPPFAGALLIPENATPQRRGIKRFANGFDRFFTFDYFPKTWRSLASGLPGPGSLGLLLRWTAGIAEMRQYYSTHTRLRLQVLRAFERTVPETFGRSPSIELEMPSAPILSDDFERVLQSKMTVFPFKVLDTKGKTVSAAGLRTIWRLLNLDASRLLPEAPVEQRRALAPRFHIGQPVALANGDEQPAVLRVALGGVLLMTVAQDPQWGLTYHDRVERLHDELLGLRRKTEAIVTHHAVLQNRLENPHQAKIA